MTEEGEMNDIQAHLQAGCLKQTFSCYTLTCLKVVVLSHKPFSQVKTATAQSEVSQTPHFVILNTELKPSQAAVLKYFNPASSLIYSNVNT